MKEPGKQLREAREHRHLTLKDLNERTKIDLHVLREIENGVNPGLPIPIYRAFIKAMARETGLDSDSILRDYELCSGEKDAPVSSCSHSSSILPSIGFRRFYVIGGALLVGILSIVLIYVFWGGRYFIDPGLPGTDQSDRFGAYAADSLGMNPFTLTVYGIKDTWVSVDQGSETVRFFLPQDSSRVWHDLQAISLGLESPERIQIFIDSLTVETNRLSMPGEAWVYLQAGQKIVWKTVRNTVGTEDDRKPNTSAPVITGHIGMDELLNAIPEYRRLKEAWTPDSLILDSLRNLKPSGDLLIFFNASEALSGSVVPRLLKIVEKTGFDQTHLQFIALDKYGKDEIGLTDFHRIRSIPAILYLYKGLELGRIVGSPGTDMEAQLLEIMQRESRMRRHEFE
ncbi:MAG TPA: hypothetical protein ENN03_01220 [bacterium]|nr:hypothetical protein [bacterium]